MTDEQITQAAEDYASVTEKSSNDLVIDNELREAARLYIGSQPWRYFQSLRKMEEAAFFAGVKYHRDHSESHPAYTDLFELLYNEHGITALQNELQEIETVCNQKLVKQLKALRDAYSKEVKSIESTGFGFLNKDNWITFIYELNKIIES